MDSSALLEGLRVMSGKRYYATYDLQAGTFSPTRRRVVLEDLMGIDRLVDE
jgi:hypothetical protein